MQNKKGFTLVELIVVITILAILGTIAFISLQGYSSESRDSKRISDLGQIRTGLQIEQAREGTVPMPTEAISVGSGTTIYTNQGYAGTGVLNSLRVSEAKDPLDDEYYTYTTNSNQTRFQLVAMLENGETVYNNLLPKTYANYENREAYTIGDPLGTLLQTTTNTPVHQLESITDIDLSGDTTEYIPVFKRGDNETSSGDELVTRLEESVADSNGTASSEETVGSGEGSSPTTVETDGDFELLSNGVVICDSANVGDTGTLDDVPYTKRNANQINTSNANTTCTSEITNMSAMFEYSTSFNQSLSNFDTSSVTDMSWMFYGAYSFNQDISNFDTSSVTDMSSMFGRAYDFNQSLSNFDTSSVTDMSSMFNGASSFNQPLSNFDTSSVTDMSYMFQNTYDFNQLLSNWDTSSVTDMSFMFSSASSFNQPLSNFNTSSVTNMNGMFGDAFDFNQDISSWCVLQISSKPDNFDDYSGFDGQTAQQPDWGEACN